VVRRVTRAVLRLVSNRYAPACVSYLLVAFSESFAVGLGGVNGHAYEIDTRWRMKGCSAKGRAWLCSAILYGRVIKYFQSSFLFLCFCACTRSHIDILHNNSLTLGIRV